VLLWLSKKTTEERNAIIYWSIPQASKKRKAFRRLEAAMQKEISERLAAKRQKKSDKERNDLGKKLLKTDTAELPILFPELEDPDRLSQLVDIMEGKIVGRRIQHLWYDEPTDSTKMWNGQVQKLRKVAKKHNKYKISYWEVTGNFAESEDTDMTVVEMAADFFLHDLEYDYPFIAS
jgi:hypothetical protein